MVHFLNNLTVHYLNANFVTKAFNLFLKRDFNLLNQDNMDLQIISDHNEEVQYKEIIKPAKQFLLIEDAQKVFAQGDYGAMLFQQISGNDCSIWHSTYNMTRDVWFRSFSNFPVLELHFMLRSDFRTVMAGLGEVIMQQSQFNFTYLPYIDTRTVFDAGSHETFDLHLSSEFLMMATEFYPLLNDFINSMDKQQASKLSKINHVANARMLLIIQEIFSCPYTGDLKKHYITGKVLDLFLLAMDIVTEHPTWKEFVLKRSDVEKIHAVKDILINELDEPSTIIQLSQRVGLNDFKLKKGFKQVFGTTIFDYRQQVRMKKAVELLTSDKSVSISEIAFMLGYNGINAFSGAFKKYFGIAPTSFRNDYPS